LKNKNVNKLYKRAFYKFKTNYPTVELVVMLIYYEENLLNTKIVNL